MRISKLLPTLIFLISLFIMSCGGSDTATNTGAGEAIEAEVEAIEADAAELESLDSEIQENADELDKALDALDQ